MSFFKNIFKKNIPERRKVARLKKTFIAQCEVKGIKSFSTIIDISESGLGIYLENPVEIGSDIFVTIQYEFINGAYSSEQLNIKLPAKVVWLKEESLDITIESKEIKDKKYRAGVELNDMDSGIREKYNELIKKCSEGE